MGKQLFGSEETSDGGKEKEKGKCILKNKTHQVRIYDFYNFILLIDVFPLIKKKYKKLSIKSKTNEQENESNRFAVNIS